MIIPGSTSSFVKAVQEFQHLGLVNKAIIDATAVDIPLITLAKNDTERKERGLRQALVLLIAFMIAPLHAKAISKLFSKGIGSGAHELNALLMQLPYKKLNNLEGLKAGILEIRHTLPTATRSTFKTLPVTDALRQRIIQAKTKFWMWDVAVCGALLSSVGHIKVMFGKLLSGKDQFSGELGIVPQKTLDRIYKQDRAQKQWQPSKLFKETLTLALGIGAPLAIGLVLSWAFKGNTPQTLKTFITRKIAPVLDYNYPRHVRWMKGWPLLSDGSQILLSLLLTTGELASARSKREFKELTIQRNSIDALFFFGTPVLMKLLSGKSTVQASRRSAIAYLASYLLASFGVAGIVALTNQSTRKAVKTEATKLNSTVIRPTREQHYDYKPIANTFITPHPIQANPLPTYLTPQHITPTQIPYNWHYRANYAS